MNLHQYLQGDLSAAMAQPLALVKQRLAETQMLKESVCEDLSKATTQLQTFYMGSAAEVIPQEVLILIKAIQVQEKILVHILDALTGRKSGMDELKNELLPPNPPIKKAGGFEL